MRVMIVEDEPPIARLLVSILHGCCPSTEIVATLKDGKQALADFETHQPQIIFTDIHMPGMDGIALMEHLHKLAPGVRLVVVSGYNDFEYARNALRFGAADYLLKPLNAEKIAQLMARFEAELRQEESEIVQQDIQRQLRGLASSLKGPETRRLLLLCAGPLPVSQDDSMSPGRIFWEQESTLNALTEKGDPLCFAGRSVAERILVFDADEKAASFLAEEMFDALQTLGPLLTGISSAGPVPLGHIGDTLRQMRVMLSRCIQIWESSLLCFPPPATPEPTEEKGRKARQRMTAQACGRIVAAMKAQRQDLLVQETSRLFEVLRHEKATQRELEYFFRKLADVFYEQNPNVNASDFQGALDDLLTSSAGEEELCAGLLTTLEYYSAQPEAETERPLLNHMREYLDRHYHEPISYTTLSREFGFVPSYLSSLFRAGLGVSPAEYLTELRMTKAKELLAENPRAMVREVAEQVGYSDPLYFSRIFKKLPASAPRITRAPDAE